MLPAFLLRYRRPIVLLAHLALAPLSYILAYQLRFDFRIPGTYADVLWDTLAFVVLARFLSFGVCGLFRGWWRHAGIRDLLDLFKAAGLTIVLVLVVFAASGDLSRVPRSVLLIDWAGSILIFGGARLFVRVLREERLERHRHATGVPALILGAGSAAEQLLRRLRIDGGTEFRPVGLIDDDPAKNGMRLHGVPVLGMTTEAARIAAQVGAKLLVIAIPSATRAEMQRLVGACAATGLEFKIVPSLRELLDGSTRVDKLREVEIDDLLGRAPVRLDLSAVEDDLAEQVVLVTGGAGSIGAELARQIAALGPRRLILLDQAESPLYFVELELRKKQPRLELVALVGDVTDPERIDSVFTEYAPRYVFHAAAYKHVPMMEHNVVEAVRNNVIGTYNIAWESARHGVAKFVLISTDKAVNPSSVMGATKRIAERIVLGLPEFRAGTTEFRAVRFGNVLGSSGSVIPVFKDQLAAGTALTVTHRDVSRYFMTIPEAVQLVLESTTLPDAAGRICMLEMGDPVRIVDLAENLIRLAGREPYTDVPIVFTGLRAGEKLHEELTSYLEATVPTLIEKVRIVEVDEPAPAEIEVGMRDLLVALEQADTQELLAAIRVLVPECVPPLRALPGSNGSNGKAHTPGTDSRVYLSPPHMGGHETRYVNEAFATNWIAPLGPNLDAFEREFCEIVDSPHAVALSSGTAALHLALQLAGVRAGDEVFVSTLTFAASVNPIRYLGGTPVFIDSETRSWNMDAELLRCALQRRATVGRLPKAVVLVHLYGQSADVAPISALCDKYGVALIEDAAEALGASYYERAPGTFGTFGIFSFNGNKILTTSGGGMLVSPDGDLIAEARKLATQARDAAPHYEHSTVGYNYRMSNVLAGIGRGQLRVLEQRVAARRSNFELYERALASLPGLDLMPEAPWGRHTRWLTVCTIDPARFGADRETVRRALEAANIEARPVWKPMHLQPVFADLEVVGGEVAERLFDTGLCLPSGSSLRRADLGRVIDIVRDSSSAGPVDVRLEPIRKLARVTRLPRSGAIEPMQTGT